MKRLLIFRFFLNLTLLNFLLFNLEKIDSGRILTSSYKNISQDLLKISYPGDLTFTYFIYSIPISLIFSYLYGKIINIKFDIDDLNSILRKSFLVFLLNASIVSSFIFFFRTYELLSRLYVLIFLILYPLFVIGTELLIHLLNKFQNKIIRTFSFSSLLFGFLLANYFLFIDSQDNVLNRNKFEEDVEVEASKIIFQDKVAEQFVLEDEECNEWKGTGIYSGCIQTESIEINDFDIQVTNIISYENELYFILKEGLIYKQSNKDESLELFLDISKRVHTEFPGVSQGLYSLAFKPDNSEFLVTYSNDDIALVIEKYYLDENKNPILDNSEILLKVSNNVRFHFGGSLYWSEYFEGYLVGIGDMRENIMPLIHSDALNTQSYKGKIILIDSDKKLDAPLINEHGLFQSFDNIVAYGLRNPWQIMEYENRLFVTDVGSQFIEELHEIDYEKQYQNGNPKSLSFGWPVLMGDDLSYSYEERNKEALTRLDGRITDLYYWNDNEGTKADEYIIENSISPALQYDHVVNPQVIRAAIIGGDIITDENSKYKDYYFFTDYVESELYGFDINTKELFIFPLPIISNATSLRVSPFSEDTILIAFINNSVMSVKLP